MSYKHLAGRLIETQRSMLGASAVEIARSVEGITVDNDGSVTDITGDSRAVVETLSQRYIEVLGSAAENRLLAAANEFRDELVLPPSLGGPDDHPGVAHDGPTTADPAGTDPTAADSSADALSDGGTVAFHSAAGTDEPADTGAVDGPTDRTRPGDTLQEVASIPDPVKVDYTVASSIPDAADTDLGSVYLMPLDHDGWQAPVSVADAVADALSDVADYRDDGIDAFVDAIDSERLLATLRDERGETVSFHLDGVTVTFHRSGSLAVH